MDKSKIGGSDIAAILGLNPYKSAIDVWNRIVNGVEKETGRAAIRGTKLESAVLDWWSEEKRQSGLSDFVVTKPVFEEVDKFRWSLDGWIESEWAVVEVKTVGKRAIRQWDEGPPVWYVTQCQWYAHWTRAKKVYLVWFDGDDINETVIMPDRQLGQSLEEAVNVFWEQYVLTRKPPKPDGSDAYTQFISGLPRGESSISLGAEAMDAFVKYYEISKTAKALETDLEKAKQEVIALLGEHEAGVCGRHKASFKEQSKRSIDWEAIAKELGVTSDMVDRHTTNKKYRVFRFY